MASVDFLAKEKIWFDKPRYDEAERRFYEHKNGGAVQTMPDVGANAILQDIARARENIQKSLAGNAGSNNPADQGEIISRIKSLELENKSLHKVVDDLRAALSRLECRVAVLEKPPAPVTAAPPRSCTNGSAVQQKSSAPAKEDEEDDDDIDLFGSDEDEEADKLKEQRLKEYAEKKAKKPAIIAKSSILLDVKPWDDETDMKNLNPEQNRPCETEHREEEEEAGTGDSRQERSRMEGEEAAVEEDFVLGVVKKAAASCGYAEQNVAKAYSSLSEGSAHQLLLKLQRGQGANAREGPRETEEDTLPEKDGAAQAEEGEMSGDKMESGIFGSSPPQTFTDLNPKLIPPEVKGPPMSTYPASLDPQLPNFQPYVDLSQPPNWSTQAPQPQSSAPKYSHSGNPHPIPSSTSSVRTKERPGSMPPPSLVVTGEQRFLEGLQTPFKLKLTDEPGNPSLRTIIIDGSNVAMSHGLGHFFSCRGIALAVQHFWDRGHRNISVLIPQFRQKNDSRTKERHFLTELQTVGLLSYTPSREVQGKRITAYDDRLILQLAQKTDGVIVTNDNLRDLLDESVVWRDIIRKRLLQYTFVGDLFMVPDDPLGRSGPHLDQFLRLQQRAPVPGSHSFAGLSSALPSKHPRSQTEVLNFRDRTAGGALGASEDVLRRHRSQAVPGRAQRENRTAEQTTELRMKLSQVFPGQDSTVTLQLQLHPAETDINLLSSFILEQME